MKMKFKFFIIEKKLFIFFIFFENVFFVFVDILGICGILWFIFDIGVWVNYNGFVVSNICGVLDVGGYSDGFE